MQWSHEPFDTDVDSGEVIIQSLIEPATGYQITINMTGSSPAMLGRYIGCAMIGFMPDEGLEEAIVTLRDMLYFYSNKPTPHRTKLAPKAIGVTIVDKEKRPDLVIT